MTKNEKLIRISANLPNLTVEFVAMPKIIKSLFFFLDLYTGWWWDDLACVEVILAQNNDKS